MNNDYLSRKQDSGFQKNKSSDLKELMTLPEKGFLNKNTYVEDAMRCFDNINPKSIITSSKLRSLYSMLCDIITNDSDNRTEKISDDCLSAMRLMRVHIIYDMGRDEKVRGFVESSHLIAYLVYIEKSRSRSDFDVFCKYFEALVAFHRYLFPKE